MIYLSIKKIKNGYGELSKQIAYTVYITTPGLVVGTNCTSIL